ncbi:uncharacterized protein LOC131946722 [Physella acuta]|uniref:uncharacterized protein LOC131946722 n=1 Tax=Physella acuta TaxID=109671 RepID=UPI0027DAC120|nr:uncharacterized protein LOC131946722 [Physella acuta]XP_059163633.1 uncharacterized protein LOC131946722 [Physella acuta]XP_059163642.1 uncharacterized protein LOC131946722 [Physella acuta]
MSDVLYRPNASRRITPPVTALCASHSAETKSLYPRFPPILPPPPAAHLPPTLPTRPPSALPSGTNMEHPSKSLSLVSNVSRQRQTNEQNVSRQRQTNEQNVSRQRQTNEHPSLFFFRTSGTLKIKVTPNAPSLPASPPPLPAPPSFMIKQPESTPLYESHNTTKDKETLETLIATTDDTKNVSKTLESEGNSIMKQLPAADEKNYKNHLIKVPTKAQNGECVHQHSLTTGGQELVQNRSKIGWIFKKKSSSLDEKVNKKFLPPEIDSIRNKSMTFADIITNALMLYRMNKTPSIKPQVAIQSHLQKATRCTRCYRSFGLRCVRYHCIRCRQSFCEKCIPKNVYDIIEQEESVSSTTRICDSCCKDIASESSRGLTRGLWSEFLQLRDNFRKSKGLEITPVHVNKQAEVQNMLDMVPSLKNLLYRFLTELEEQLEKQTRHTFLANYLHLENTSPKQLSKKNKECKACKRQLRMLSDIRDCCLCQQTFCMSCTYKTLQVYLPSETNLNDQLDISQIKIHVIVNEQDEINAIEASEVYRVCAQCEGEVVRSIDIMNFNLKLTELEREMFDLQRQIEHALSYDPSYYRMQRSLSAANVSSVGDSYDMTGNVRLANRLYERYTRAYDNLTHMSPLTNGQKILHKHIKQAMYEFYLKRRNQLKLSLRRRDSCLSLSQNHL